MTCTTRSPSHYVACRHCGKKFRAVNVFHLRAAHGYEGDHPVREYKAEFKLPFSVCENTRQRISEAKELFWEEQGQHWTPADIVAEIQRLHQAGQRLRRSQVPVNLYEVGRRVFGTWKRAVEAAGLPYEEVSGVRRWTRAKVIEHIQRLAARGVPLHATSVSKHYPHLHRAATKLFPRSWAKALRAAGFDPAQYKMQRGTWNRASAAEWVRNRVARGKPILAGNAPADLLRFVHRRLGLAWGDYVESLGIPFPGIKKRRDWTRETLLEEMRRWKAEGHPLNYAAVKESYQALIHQARKFFDSWDQARAAAGV